jgi:hypothetical protein
MLSLVSDVCANKERKGKERKYASKNKTTITECNSTERVIIRRVNSE